MLAVHKGGTLERLVKRPQYRGSPRVWRLWTSKFPGKGPLSLLWLSWSHWSQRWVKTWEDRLARYLPQECVLFGDGKVRLNVFSRRNLLTRTLEKYRWHLPVFFPLESPAWAAVCDSLPPHPVLSLLRSGSIRFLGWVDWGPIRWRRVMRSEQAGRKNFVLKIIYPLLGNGGDRVFWHSVQLSKLNFQLLWGVKG